MTIHLSGRPITLGRRSDNDVVVDETTVSRRHGLIMETPAGFVILDLNTTNGTFVNQDKIGLEEYVLTNGDAIRLAGSKVTFLYRRERAEIEQMGRVEERATGEIVLRERTDHDEPKLEEIKPSLEAKDRDLYRFLESKRGIIVSRQEVARNVWPELPDGRLANKAIDECMGRLLEEIEDDPLDPVHLITVGEFGLLLI
jgi:hypothetical protein